MVPIFREFGSTEAAYAACQCDSSVQVGDTLIVYREKVIGLAWTWPLAITVEAGELHTMAQGGNFVRVMADAGITVEAVRKAVREAQALGWAVVPGWLEIVTRFEKGVR